MGFALKLLALLGTAAALLYGDEGGGPLFISLGAHCEPTFWLKAYGLRHAAFPFDWLLTTDDEKLIELLETDFAHFLDRSCFTVFPKAFVNTCYNIEFRHEGEHIEEIFSKYPRRIERFRQLASSSRRVVFIRMSYHDAASPSIYYPNEKLLHITPQSAFALSKALRRRFPRLDFTLLIINQKDPADAAIIGDVIMVGGCARKERMIALFEALAAGRLEEFLGR